mgnify:FL=1
MRKTLNVIRSEREGSIGVIRKTISVIRKMVRLGEIYRSSKKETRSPGAEKFMGELIKTVKRKSIK